MVAPRILWRYILREALLHSLLGLTVFTLVILMQNVLRFLGELLAAGIQLEGVVRLVGIILPSYLPYAIPTSLLFGIMLTFGRMSADGEIIAIRSSGVSVLHLLPPILAIGTVATLVTGYLSFEIAPQSHHQMKTLMRDMARSVKVIRSGGFRSIGTHRIVYVESEGDADCALQGMLIGDFSDAERPLYIFARCGSVAENRSDAGLALELREGAVHFEDDRTERYRRVRFERMTMELDIRSWLESARRTQDHTTAELFELDRRFAAGETPELRGRAGRNAVQVQLHRRFAFSLASVLLGVLAVPLGIRPVRTGRSAGALTAIALMGLYWLLLSSGETLAMNHLLPPWLALWTPNVLLVGIGLFLLRRTTQGES
jgi:lipopolysaccharide export system permease protein